MNTFILKKMISYAIMGFLPLISFAIISIFYHDLIMASVVGMGLIGAGMFILPTLINHPFISVLEGKGLICFDINSSGVFDFYLVNVINKAGTKKLSLITKSKEVIESAYNRTIGAYISIPKQVTGIDSGEEITITINKNNWSKEHFGFNHLPAFIFNSKLNSFVTKEFLAEKENIIMTEYLSLVVNEQAKAMQKEIRELTRHFSDLFQVSKLMELLSNPLFIGFIILICIVFVVMFALPILPKLMGYSGEAMDVVTGSVIQ